MRPSRLSQILKREFNGAQSSPRTPVMLWGPSGAGKPQIVAN